MIDRRAVAVANAARADLVDRLGADRVLVGEKARLAVGLEPGEGDGPVAVMRPRNPEQVALSLKVGRSRHLPVRVRSRLPALHPAELRGALVLDSRGLDRPPAIDISRRVVTVGAGVDVAAVDRAARQARLCLRGVPAWRTGATVGSLLGAGDPGEIGVADGSVVDDLLSALVVGGTGRITQLGGPSLVGAVPWACPGLPDPLGLMVGSEGRMGVLCEVTLRLHRAPHVAWVSARLEGGREPLLRVISAARLVTSRRVVDTILYDETDDGAMLSVRAATWRGVEDLAAVMTQASAIFARHGVALVDWQGENQRVRLGHEPGPWPQPAQPTAATLDLRVNWADASKVLDVSDALCAADPEGGRVPRGWAIGAEHLRLRHLLPATRPDRHPLVTGIRHLIDAGALPVGIDASLRELLRDRMTSSSKVLLAGLVRAWDPDEVLAPRTGLL